MREWYRLSIEDLTQTLQVSLEGLKETEVKERQAKWGQNQLPKHQKNSVFRIFLGELKDPIELILVVAIFFSFLIGEVVDAIAILLIVLVDLMMGTYQEWKARKNDETLSQMIQEKTRVLREGKELLIESQWLVPGDLILLESGDKIGADARLLECQNLQMDESVLTGESTATIKNSETISNKVTLAEQKNMVFAGTSVLTGRAKALVVATGIHTEIGQIADKVTTTKEEKSPLTIRMEKFSKQISMVIFVIALLITIALSMNGVDHTQIFLSVIALSVSAMPEGLPLALTMALTIASNRMSKKM